MKRRLRLWLPILAAVPLLSTSATFGQINTATISGRITDPTSAVIPSAQIRVTNEGTGGTKTTLSNANGEYSFTFLMPGTYDVAVTAKDFQPFVRQGVAVVAGQLVSIDFQLKVGTITQTETVSAQATLLNTESSHQLQALTNLEVTQLPDSKLDWTNLLIMGTGISKVTGLQGAGSVGGIVMNGMSSSAMNVTIDGTNSSNDPELPTFGFYGGMNIINQLGSDSIAEVSVVKGIMPASVSNTLSGNINLITKSGTNNFHGSAFELNDVALYDARNQFLATKPGSTFNQYGGSFGGPIVKDKLFSFGSYEGVRWSRLAPLSGNVPTPYLESIAPSIFSSQWSLYPSVPQPAGAPTAVSALWFGAGSKVNNDANIVVRGDYYISPTNQLTVRYTRATPYQNTPRVIASNSQSYSGTDQTVNATFVHTTGHITSSTRFGYNRIRQARTDNGYGSDLEGVSFSGISSGGAEVFHLLGGTQTYQEDLTISHGHHLLQLGGIVQRQAAGRPDINTSTFSYSSLPDFLANIPSSVQITFDVPNINLANLQLGAYVQDDYKLLPNFTLNFGVRYDVFTVPESGQVFNRGIDPARPQLGYGFGPYRPGNSLYHGDFNNFQPRLGFAWSLGSTRKTVIRGGAGFFASPHPLYAGIDNDRQSSAEVPFRSTTSRSTNVAGAIAYPIPPAQFIPTLNRLISERILSANIASSDAIATNYPDPYSAQWMVGVEHEFGFGVVATANYVANRALKLIANYFGNAPDRLTGVAPDPTFGQFLVVNPIDASSYESLQTNLSKRFSNGLVFNVNYTYSSNTSFGAGDVAAYQVSYLTQPNNPRADLGPTPFSQPHIFNETLVYQLPFTRWTRAHGRAARALIDGWQFSEVFSDTSGLPLNVTDSASIYPQDRPDSGAGVNAINSDYRSTLVYLNPAAFRRVPIVPASGAQSHPGDLGRSAYRLPPVWNVDASVAKSFNITERAHIQFRADFLNAFNHTNLSGLTTNINSGSFGRFTSATARNIQLGARIQF
jgi:outer membrane receptor protein involved in Fe transport